MAIPTKISERLIKGVNKFQTVLKMAKDKDLNESDTVQIISDILAEVFGYDKYLEVTSELAIRGTFCDLAIKIDEKFQFMIECKSIGTALKDAHLRQVVDYGAKQGVPWVVLTNGVNWDIYKIKFEQPISYDLVCSLDMLSLSPKKEEEQEKLFILCKEGLSKDSRENFYEKVQCINRFVIGGFILSEPVISAIRKEIRKYAEGLKVENEEIEQIVRHEVMKREILEGDDAAKILSKIKRFYNKQNRQKGDKNTASDITTTSTPEQNKTESATTE